MEKIEQLKNYARKNFIPVILDDGKEFLCKIVKEKQPLKILEIGTAVGYSGSIMLKNCNANLTTIENDKQRFELAKETFLTENLADRVTQIYGDAFEKIKVLNDKFDFIFLDGPKGQYINYLPYLKALLQKNGTLVADNILFKGLVLSDAYPKHKNRTIIFRLRKFINAIKNDTEFDTTIYDIGDGISVSIKKS